MGSQSQRTVLQSPLANWTGPEPVHTQIAVAMTGKNEAVPERRCVGPYLAVPILAGLSAVVLAFLDPFRIAVGAAHVAGILPLAVGFVLVYWSIISVKQDGETLSPVANPESLVTTGAFAHTRNPMYLGVILTVIGVAVGAGSPVATGYAGLLWSVYHGIVVTVEEPKLRDRFETAYHQYCSAVPRWIPRLWRRR